MAHVHRSGVSPVLAFILGAVLVAAAVFAWFALTGGSSIEPTASLSIEGPKLPDLKMPDAPKLPRG